VELVDAPYALKGARLKIYSYEVVKQYIFWVENLPHTVKARVSRNLDPTVELPYRWEISHYYKPSGAGGVYHPSKLSAETQKEAEQFMRIYAEFFTDIGVTQNENY